MSDCEMATMRSLQLAVTIAAAEHDSPNADQQLAETALFLCQQHSGLEVCWAAITVLSAIFDACPQLAADMTVAVSGLAAQELADLTGPGFQVVKG